MNPREPRRWSIWSYVRACRRLLGRSVRQQLRPARREWFRPVLEGLEQRVLLNGDPLETTTRLLAAPDPTVFGQAVTLTAIVAPKQGDGVPTGTVNFREGSQVLGSGTLSEVNGNNQATLTIASLGVGQHEVKAEYQGDDSDRPSQSSAVQQEVDQADTTLALSASPNPAHVNSTVTVTAIVAAVSPGSGAPTGTVAFQDNGQPLGQANLQVVNGRLEAVFQFTVTRAGDESLSASYAGDVNFRGSQGGTLLDPPYAVGVTLTQDDDDPSYYGEPCTFIATAHNQDDPSIIPVGVITFYRVYRNQDPIATVRVDSSGTATLVTSSLLPNGYAIGAVFYPDDPSMFGQGDDVMSHGVILPAVPPVANETPDTCNCAGDNGSLLGTAAGAGNGLADSSSSGGAASASEYSGNPVRYFDGVIQLASTDLSSNGFGVPWGQTRSWTNGPNYASASHNGNGWVNTELPTLVRTDNNNLIDVVLNGSRTLYYVVDPDENLPVIAAYFGAGQKETLTYDSSTHTYTETDTNGDQIAFEDFQSGAKSGQFKSFTDPNGNVVQVTAWTTNGQAAEIQRSGTTSSGATVVESYLYTYGSSGGSAGNITSITLRRGPSTTGPWTTIRSVGYEYYNSGDSNGNAGDLKRATIYDASGDPLSRDYYRYYTSNQAPGYQGGLKYVVTGDSYLRAAASPAAQNGDPGTLSDTVLSGFAQNYFEYDSAQRVTKEVAQGAGSSTAAGGLGTFTYSYTVGSNPYGMNSWFMKTIETLPGGNQNIVYTNGAGEPILKVALNTTTNQQWLTYFQYDSSGDLILTASPSAVSGYDDTYADLVIDNNGTNQYLNPASGLITLDNYATATTATSSTAGDVAGYLKSVQIELGYSGTPVTQESWQYLAHTANSVTIYAVASDTVYRNTDGTGAEITSDAYTWFSGTNMEQSVTVTYPTISAAQNGPGTAATETTVFDVYGQPIWHKDAAGFLTFTGYDNATGVVVTSIQDVDTTKTSEFYGLPTGWSTPTGGGQNLASEYVVDALGRTTEEIDPKHYITYTVYNDANHEVRVYPGFQAGTGLTTGPTQVYRDDLSGSYTEVYTMTTAPHLTGGVPDGTEAAGNLATLSRQHVNAAGQVDEVDDYFNLQGVQYTSATFHLGAVNQNYYETAYGYDVQGRQNYVLSPTGTITRTVYDFLGRALGVWIGTNDSGATDSDPTGGGAAGNNMVQVAGYVYDNNSPGATTSGVGDGDLTKLILNPGGGAAEEETDYYYDWRDRPVLERDGAELVLNNRPPPYYVMSDITSTYLTYDNLGEVTEQQTFAGDEAAVYFTNGVPNAPAATSLRAETQTAFDDQGRPYQQQIYSVDPASGAVSSTALTTSYYYDNRGDLIATSAPGGLWTKQSFDGAGRLTVTYSTDGAAGTTWPDAAGVANDVVLEQQENHYDANGNVTETIDRQRFDNATGTGPLGTPTSGVLARDYYVGYYYNAVNQPTAQVDVGTNGGTAWTMPPTAPTGSNTVLVASDAYNIAGWLSSATDPAGNVTQTAYDNLGRVTQTIAAYTGSGPTNNSDQTTNYTYDGDNHVLTVTALLPGNAEQQTQYLYGTTLATSGIASNDLLAATEYPDPSTGLASANNKESYTYNALGQVTGYKDRNGTIHAYSYDLLGRQTADAITTFGTGVDRTIQELDTGYNDQGLPYLYTSDGANGSVLDQVEDVYNGLGQLTGEYQAHNGSVNTSTTPEVQYVYNDMAGGTNNSRLTAMIYPNGRYLNYYYTYEDNAISRLSNLSDSNGTVLEAYTYLGLDTVVQRAHPEAKSELTYISQNGQPGDAGDRYTGLDRFGRVVDQFWLNTSNNTANDRIQYGYDQDSNVLFANNLVDAVFSQLDSYNALNELTGFQQGQLNSTDTGIVGTPSESLSWNLDALGNFSSVTGNGTTTTRTHNADNQTTVVGNSTLSYDNNGNFNGQTNGGSINRTGIYDAWNRLVEVLSFGSQIVAYSYDALGRRITQSDNQATPTDLYYDANWNVIEEQVSGQTQIQYVWSPVAPDTLVLRDTITNGTVSKRLYVEQDANGNVTSLVDTTGTVVERYVYQPYGLGTIMNGNWGTLTASAYGWQYLFQGGRYDATVGFYDFRNRLYSPTLGRWVKQDPIGFAAGDLNFYRFTHNQPCDFVDPLGLNDTCMLGYMEAAKERARRARLPAIGGDYQAKLDLRGFTSNAERQQVIAATYQAALEVHQALYILENWDEFSSQFRYYQVKGVTGIAWVQSDQWAKINANRDLLLRRLRSVFNELMSPNTVIQIVRTNETHPEKNPMYTTSSGNRLWEIAEDIRLRTHYWELQGLRPYYTRHEFGRYFLLLDDDSDYKNGQGVQAWDSAIDWLSNKYGERK